MENIKILQEKENSLFNRKEIQLSVEAEITPNHEDIKKLISEKFSTKIENIKIKKISGKFGSKTFTITANIYSSEEDKNKTEPKLKKKAEKKIAEADTSDKGEVKKEEAEQSSQTESSLDNSSNKSEPTGEANKSKE